VDYGWSTRVDVGGKNQMSSVIAWESRLEDALERARSQNKHVLLDFSAAPM